MNTYKIERILDCRERKNSNVRIQGRFDENRRPKLYLVKWIGYPESEATWEKEEDLREADEMIKEFQDHQYVDWLQYRAAYREQCPVDAERKAENEILVKNMREKLGDFMKEPHAGFTRKYHGQDPKNIPDFSDPFPPALPIFPETIHRNAEIVGWNFSRSPSTDVTYLFLFDAKTQFARTQWLSTQLAMKHFPKKVEAFIESRIDANRAKRIELAAQPRDELEEEPEEEPKYKAFSVLRGRPRPEFKDKLEPYLRRVADALGMKFE